MPKLLDFDFEVLSPKSVENGGDETGFGNGDNGNEQENSNLTPALLNGHHLSIALRQKVRKEFTGVGLKEIDQFYKNDNTFVVIGRGSRILYRFGNADTYLKSNGGWRSQAISILSHGVFNYFMVFAILLNCIIYAGIPVTSTQTSNPESSLPDGVDSSPSERHHVHDFTKLAKVSNLAFLIIYMVEFLLKILARGLYKSGNSFSCLAISWSWLDIFVILIGVLSVLNPGNLPLSALNALRALKLIPLLPSWLSGYDRMFAKSWKRLRFVFFYACIMTALLGLLASSMYVQSLGNKCVDTNFDTSVGGSSNESEFNEHTTEHFLCSNSSWSEPCPNNFTCMETGENPQRGYVSFDTFRMSEFTLLNILFQDFAEFVYEKIWMTNGPFHLLYFLLVFFFGTFSIGTLVYAVIGYEFENGFTELRKLNNLKEKEIDVAEDDSAGHDGKLQKLKDFGTNVVKHDYFDIFITLCILLDILCHGLDHYGLEDNKSLLYFTTITIWVVRSVYVLECIFKIIFLGPSTYFKTFWNWFDFVIAAAIILNIFIMSNTLAYGLTITCLKIVPRWPTLNFTFNVFYKAFSETSQWLFGIYAIFLFVFAYIGYIRFGNDYTDNIHEFNGDLPNWNMIDMWHSIRLMFRAFCGEWTETLWDLLLVSPASSAITLMVFAGVVGNVLTKMLGIGIMLTASNELDILQSEASNKKQTSLELIFTPCAWIGSKIGLCAAGESQHDKSDDVSLEPLNSPIKNNENTKENVINGIEDDLPTTTSQKQDDASKPPANLLQKILSHFVYRIFTCALIIVLSFLAIKWDFVPDIIFVVYFGIEVILRLIAFGIKIQTFNVGLIFDVIMIVNSILALSLDQPHGLLHLGSFRILTVISRSGHLKIVVSQLWHQLNILFHHLLATFFIWFVFALVGMTLFLGKFHKCVDLVTGVLSPEVSVETKFDCVANNLTWTSVSENFDSLPNSLWSLLYVACRNGWILHIGQAEESRGELQQPERDANSIAILYFAAFLLFGTLFPFYIMAGVLFNDFKKWIQIFSKESEKADSSEKDEKKTKACTAAGTSKQTCQKVEACVLHTNFEVWVCLTIIADAIVIAIDVSLHNTIEISVFCHFFQAAILLLFIIELILKALTLKKNFFKNWLNILLLFVVLSSTIELVMVEFLSTVYSVSTLLRVLRLLHLLSLDKICEWNFPGLRCFRSGLSNSILALTNIFSFYTLIFFSYALFGAWCFNHVPEFASWHPVTSLFRIATISGIDGIYDNIATGDCEMKNIEDETSVCGGAWLGVLYITTFLAITILTFVNMYFVLILETVAQLRKNQTSTKPSDSPDVATPNTLSVA